MDSLTSFEGVGLAVAILLLLLTRLLLPAADRRRLRLPTIALIAHGGVLGVRSLLPAEHAAADVLDPLALLLLLVALGRIGFLLLVHSSLARRINPRPLPRIFRDIFQGAIYV